MTTYGLTRYGFVLKRGNDIISDIKAQLRLKYPDLDLTDDSVIMQIIGILVEPYAELWELANAVYNSQYPNSAEGQSLDNLCELNAIERLEETYSKVVISLQGALSTVVDTTFKVETESHSATFKAIEIKTISDTDTNWMKLFVNIVVSNTNYTIVINGHTVTINSGAGATAIIIAQKLHDQINTISDVLAVTATLPSPQDGHFMITSNDTDVAFLAQPGIGLKIMDFYTPIWMECETEGPIPAPTGTINQILTPVSGVYSVINLKDAEEGRATEDDTPLRQRRYENIRVVGAATVEAIRARIMQEVANVIQCKVYENHELYTDAEGRPPKSLEALILGGTKADIALKIWQTKAGGIETYGNQSFTIVDSMGYPQLIKFSRPIEKFIWLRITLTVNSEFPNDGQQTIMNNILELANSKFGISDDVLIQSLYCPIYAVKGVISSLIEIAATYDLTPPTTYVTTNIPVGQREVAVFDSSRINFLMS